MAPAWRRRANRLTRTSHCRRDRPSTPASRRGRCGCYVGEEQFSENHAWSGNTPRCWPSRSCGPCCVVEVVGQGGQLEARVGRSPAVPATWSSRCGRRCPGELSRPGSLGLVQQFGVRGSATYDLDAAPPTKGCRSLSHARPRRRAVIAEHAVAPPPRAGRAPPRGLEGLPRASRWGGGRWPLARQCRQPASSAPGPSASEIARHFAAFDVTVTGVRRRIPHSSPVPPFAATSTAPTASSTAWPTCDSVIISAGYQAGQPPLVPTTLRYFTSTCAPAPGSVNHIARGALPRRRRPPSPT